MLEMLLGTVLLLFQAAFPFYGAVAREGARSSAAPAGDDVLDARYEKVVVFLVDALSPTDLADPAWRHLRQTATGAVGLMSTRAAGPHTSPAAHATIAAGARSTTPPRGGLTLAAYEQYGGADAGTVHAALTGAPAGDAAAFFLGAAPLFAAVPAPTLGSLLADAGLKAAAIGNADTFAGEAERRRFGALLAADADGRVPYGDVGAQVLVNDPAWPFGWRTDYEATWAALEDVYDAADFIVVELGDLARLDAYASWLPPERLRQLRRTTMERIDAFVGRLLQRTDAAGHLLVLVSPSPPSEALRRGVLLAPVVVAAPKNGAAAPQLLTSNTTRRAGIVVNFDIAPTVLAAFGLDAAPLAGTPLRAVPLTAAVKDAPYGTPANDDAWSTMAALYERVTLTNSLRAPVVRGFVGFSIVVFVGWSAWLAYAAAAKAPGPESRLTLWRSLLLLLHAGPLAMLALPIFRPQDAASSLALLVVIAGTATAAAQVLFRRHGVDAFIALSLATALLLLVDVILGARLIKNSVLGHDPIVAARFYGIGNEYVGVLIGTCLVGTTGLLDRWAGRAARCTRLWFAVAGTVYAGAVLVLASPSLGANVGGTVAAVVGFGTTLLLLANGRLSWRTLPALIAAVAATLAAAAFIDVTIYRDEPSHLGRALLALLEEGWGPITAIAARKLAMNVTLLRWTIWAQVFVVSLAISAVALYRPGAAVRKADARHPFLLKGIRGALVGALAALAVNDSGVVAAATLMIPVTSTLVYILLPQRQPA